MARIQKKKPATQKKKAKAQGSAEGRKEAGAGASPAGASGGGSGDGSGPVSGEAAKEKKQKRAISAKKASPSGQSFVLRLVDRYFGKWIQFLREVKIELGKVTWPSRKQTIGSTVVVLVFVFIIAMFLGMVDIGLSSLVRLIL